MYTLLWCHKTIGIIFFSVGILEGSHLQIFCFFFVCLFLFTYFSIYSLNLFKTLNSHSGRGFIGSPFFGIVFLLRILCFLYSSFKSKALPFQLYRCLKFSNLLAIFCNNENFLFLFLITTEHP